MLKIFEFFQSVQTFVVWVALLSSFVIPLGILIVWLCTEVFKNIKKTFSIKKLFSFYGRSRRIEYWIILVIEHIFSAITSTASNVKALLILPLILVVFLAFLHFLITFLLLSVASRRLRDAGLSSWLLIIFLIPVFLSSLSLNKNLYLIFLVITLVFAVILGILPSVIDKENKNPLHEKMSSRT